MHQQAATRQRFALPRRRGDLRPNARLGRATPRVVLPAALEIAAELPADKTVLAIFCDTGERYLTVEKYFNI